MKSLSVKLGVILIGLIILGYAEVCNAQCAWVLWERQYMVTEEGKVANPGEWGIVAAYPKYEQCFERQKKEFLDLKEAPGFKVISRPFEYVMGRKEGGKLVILQELKCLPDTIDPRK